MRLYYRPATGRATRVAWTLEEIGATYEVVRVTTEEATGSAHHARHPLGRVPVLELQGGELLFESAALVLQLADLFPDAGLIPPPGSVARGRVYQWVFAAMTELERPVSDYALHRETHPDWARCGVERFQERASALAPRIGAAEFIVGETLSAADIVLGGVLSNARFFDLLGDFPSLTAYVERLQARPAFTRAATIVESLFSQPRR